VPIHESRAHVPIRWFVGISSTVVWLLKVFHPENAIMIVLKRALLLAEKSLCREIYVSSTLSTLLQCTSYCWK